MDRLKLHKRRRFYNPTFYLHSNMVRLKQINGLQLQLAT